MIRGDADECAVDQRQCGVQAKTSSITNSIGLTAEKVPAFEDHIPGDEET